ncbi:hypothetical protein H671_6g16839 [Cricetulus griseus]|nr:hypothetical protein H671_6g16839 [Cricetulus griseus]
MLGKHSTAKAKPQHPAHWVLNMAVKHKARIYGQVSPPPPHRIPDKKTVLHVDIVSSEKLTVQETYLQSPSSVRECTSWKKSVVEKKLKWTGEHSLGRQTRNNGSCRGYP